MPVSRCRHCQALLFDHEGQAAACPVCGNPRGATPGTGPVRRRWPARPVALGVGLAALLSLGVLAACLLLREPPRPLAVERPGGLPTSEGAPVLGVDIQTKPFARAELRPPGDALELDCPEGNLTLEPADASSRRTLSGRVKTLTLGDVNGEAVVDASRLEAQRVVVRGRINGRTRVMLRASSVEFQKGVHDESEVTVEAPGGRVVFSGADGINGSARVALTAREVLIGGGVVGGTRVRVTLTAGGSLRFDRTDGGALLEYRKAAPDDPAPRIQRGQVKDGSRFGQAKG